MDTGLIDKPSIAPPEGAIIIGGIIIAIIVATMWLTRTTQAPNPQNRQPRLPLLELHTELPMGEILTVRNSILSEKELWKVMLIHRVPWSIGVFYIFTNKPLVYLNMKRYPLAWIYKIPLVLYRVEFTLGLLPEYADEGMFHRFVMPTGIDITMMMLDKKYIASRLIHKLNRSPVGTRKFDFYNNYLKQMIFIKKVEDLYMLHAPDYKPITFPKFKGEK